MKHHIKCINKTKKSFIFHIRFDVLEGDKRPVSAVADHTEFRDVVSVEIEEDRSTKIRLLFDPEHNLEERILREQFDH